MDQPPGLGNIHFVDYLYDYLFPALWIAFMAYWWAMARGGKAVTRREDAVSGVLRSALMTTGTALLVIPQVRFLPKRFIEPSNTVFWISAAITAAGLLFCVWARQYLGGNWSRAVTVKQDHELITSGPYALVRHPIYTGLIVAVAGSALAIGRWRAVAGTVLFVLALWLKLRLEERFMKEQFGAAYEAYARGVKAIVPFIF